MPWQNHSWHPTLYLSPQGYTTQGIPYRGRIFQIEFDFEKHKVFSAGFWPGSQDFPPAFYTYAYPADPAFSQQKVLPDEAFYSPEMGEFFLKYEDVRESDYPEGMLLAFLQSIYEAAAITSNWDRNNLERKHG
jgi:hypothetical protein